MPPSVLLGTFILGAILLLVALLGGAFELFNAKVLGPVGKIERVIAGIVGTVLIIIALANPFERTSTSFSPSPSTAVVSTVFTPTSLPSTAISATASPTPAALQQPTPQSTVVNPPPTVELTSACQTIIGKLPN